MRFHRFRIHFETENRKSLRLSQAAFQKEVAGYFRQMFRLADERGECERLARSNKDL